MVEGSDSLETAIQEDAFVEIVPHALHFKVLDLATGNSTPQGNELKMVESKRIGVW